MGTTVINQLPPKHQNPHPKLYEATLTTLNYAATSNTYVIKKG